MICQPYFVSTGFEILLFLPNSNAAFSNGIELICPLENGVSLPPLKDEFLSSEYFLAKYSKPIPLFKESKILFILL